MTVEVECPFYVNDNSNSYDSNFSASLDGATNYARSQAWRNGRPYIVYKAVAVVEAPEMVNDVKVTTL
jgi:hypothetical protein